MNRHSSIDSEVDLIQPHFHLIEGEMRIRSRTRGLTIYAYAIQVIVCGVDESCLPYEVLML